MARRESLFLLVYLDNYLNGARRRTEIFNFFFGTAKSEVS